MQKAGRGAVSATKLHAPCSTAVPLGFWCFWGELGVKRASPEPPPALTPTHCSGPWPPGAGAPGLRCLLPPLPRARDSGLEPRGWVAWSGPAEAPGEFWRGACRLVVALGLCCFGFVLYPPAGIPYITPGQPRKERWVLSSILVAAPQTLVTVSEPYEGLGRKFKKCGFLSG